MLDVGINGKSSSRDTIIAMGSKETILQRKQLLFVSVCVTVKTMLYLCHVCIYYVLKRRRSPIYLLKRRSPISELHVP